MMMLFRNADDRLRAISDGVFAVVLTIMVLNIKVPTSPLTTATMYTLGQAIATYLISFAVVAQYWHFHQELFSRNATLPTTIIILNSTYLALICLLPFATAWLKDSGLTRSSAIAFAVVIMLVDTCQLLLFRGMIHLFLQPPFTLTAHDHEEYRSVKVMLALSGIYLLVSLTYPHFILVVIVAGLLFRVVSSRLIRWLARYRP